LLRGLQGGRLAEPSLVVENVSLVAEEVLLVIEEVALVVQEVTLVLEEQGEEGGEPL